MSPSTSSVKLTVVQEMRAKERKQKYNLYFLYFSVLILNYPILRPIIPNHPKFLLILLIEMRPAFTPANAGN